jgi:hypothetical protein
MKPSIVETRAIEGADRKRGAPFGGYVDLEPQLAGILFAFLPFWIKNP